MSNRNLDKAILSLSMYQALVGFVGEEKPANLLQMRELFTTLTDENAKLGIPAIDAILAYQKHTREEQPVPPTPVIDEDKLDGLMIDLRRELSRAIGKHPKYPTAHHGHSVIMEEVDELWDHVKADDAHLGPARREAIQIACTAIRFALDICV